VPPSYSILIDWYVLFVFDFCLFSHKHPCIFHGCLQSVTLASLNYKAVVYTQHRCANLTVANLRGAILYFANLRDAGLGGANLRDADLEGALMKGAILCNTTMPDGSVIYSGC